MSATWAWGAGAVIGVRAITLAPTLAKATPAVPYRIIRRLRDVHASVIARGTAIGAT